jgi:hypothetical protein
MKNIRERAEMSFTSLPPWPLRTLNPVDDITYTAIQERPKIISSNTILLFDRATWRIISVTEDSEGTPFDSVVSGSGRGQ